MAGESGPVAEESAPIAGESAPMTGESGPVAGEPGQIAGESGPVTGESGPVAGESGLAVEESAPVAGELAPVAEEPVEGDVDLRLTGRERLSAAHLGDTVGGHNLSGFTFMRSRPLRELLLLAAAALAAGGCSNPSDSDPLTAARRNLRIAPCGPDAAVAGAAGVNPEPRGVYLTDWIVVAVCHLDELAKRAEAAQQPITLFIEGLDSGNEPVGIDLDSGIVTFTLDRDEDNRPLWKPLLYNPLFDPTTTMRISAGIRSDRPLPRVAGANTTLVLYKVYTG
jgi:hypothetical protein